MDPATIIGTTSAILGIVGVVAKSVTTLSDLRDRFQNISLEVLSLITQLSSLKAALTKISEWIQSDLTHTPQHHQLVMDLNNAIVSCRLVVQSLDNHIDCLKRKDDGSLALSSEIRLILHTSSFRDLQAFLERQISALNLLLTACSCTSLSEQKTWLEDSDNRAVLDQSQDDSSSLVVLYDSSSLLSRSTMSTGTLTNFSIEFPFDDILMKSKVYRRTIRGLFRSSPPDRLRKRVAAIGAPWRVRRSKEATMRSQIIEDQIKRDQLEAGKRIELLMTGTSDIDLQVMFWRLQYLNYDTLDDDLKPLCVIITAFKDFQQRLKSGLLELSPINEQTRGVSRRLPNISSTESLEEFLSPVPSDLNTKQQLAAIDKIWRQAPENIKAAADPVLRSVLQDLHNVFYFIKRPSDEYLVEIARLQHPTQLTTLETAALHSSPPDIHISKVGCPLSKDSLHQFANVKAIIFVVDAQSFYKSTSDGRSLVLENLERYKQLVNHALFQSTPLLLIFNNVRVFAEEFLLPHAKFANVFPQFHGGDDWAPGFDFILNQFCSVAKVHTPDRWIYVRPEYNRSDHTFGRFFYAVIHDISIREFVRGMQGSGDIVG